MLNSCSSACEHYCSEVIKNLQDQLDAYKKRCDEAESNWLNCYSENKALRFYMSRDFADKEHAVSKELASNLLRANSDYLPPSRGIEIDGITLTGVTDAE